MRFALAFLFALPLVAGWLPGTAVGQDSEARLFILHDVPDDGYTYAGNLNHFGYALLNADRATTVHKQGCIIVEQNGLLLYRTTPDSAHDYNALNSFAVTFPVEGPYSVTASIPTSGGSCEDPADPVVFRGYAHAAPAPLNATLRVSVPNAAARLVPAPFTFEVLDEQGNLIPHSDVLVEIRRPADGWLVLRSHLHTHEDPMTMCFAFPSDGPYLLRVIGYNAFPTPDGVHFLPVTYTSTIAVSGSLTGDSCPLTQPACTPPSLPRAAAGTGPLRMLTTFDPQDANTVWSRTTMHSLTFDPEADAFRPHVDYSARIQSVAQDCSQFLFASPSLHEYDGNLEIEFNWPLPGVFLFEAEASTGDWSDSAATRFTFSEALPPTGTPKPAAPGSMVVRATGLDEIESGRPSKVTFETVDAAGQPLTHSEISFQITSDSGAPLLSNKIHTHGSGKFEVTLTLPEPGDYRLILDPLTVHGEPITEFYFGQVGGDLVVPLNVPMGLPLPVPTVSNAPTPALETGHGHFLPGLGLVVLGPALAAAALMRRRA